MTLIPTLKLSLEMTNVLAHIEQNGIKINKTTLAEIREEYEQELFQLERRLNELAQYAMGDTPVNLDSPDDRSMLMYSCKVIDKKTWAEIFNLGHEVRGATKKPKMRKRMSRAAFKGNVLRETDVVYKTIGSQCSDCNGKGRYNPLRKDGSVGMSLSLRGDAREFAQSYIRYSALRTYLRSFVEGMENNMDSNGFIHTEFMQCVTATGRLSSRNPNFQNMPRGSTFAIRRAVESRFEGGQILEGDYSQLEFRVAGYLANDDGILTDVEAGTDVHSYTASVIGCTRQEAKAHTFKPLYGGVSGTDDQQRYYRAFKEKYRGVTEWHKSLQKDAVTKKEITLPSGRQYAFPDAKWTEWGTATNRTAICNYPVQGFATADLLPMALVKLHHDMEDMRSVICNTVHDSIVIDVYPGEEDQCVQVMSNAMLCLPQETKRRYNKEYSMPVGIELKMGKNWLDLEAVFEV